MHQVLFCLVTFETKMAFSVILKRNPEKVVCSQNEQCYHVKPCNKCVRLHLLGSQAIFLSPQAKEIV